MFAQLSSRHRAFPLPRNGRQRKAMSSLRFGACTFCKSTPSAWSRGARTSCSGRGSATTTRNGSKSFWRRVRSSNTGRTRHVGCPRRTTASIGGECWTVPRRASVAGCAGWTSTGQWWTAFVPGSWKRGPSARLTLNAPMGAKAADGGIGRKRSSLSKCCSISATSWFRGARVSNVCTISASACGQIGTTPWRPPPTNPRGR